MIEHAILIIVGLGIGLDAGGVIQRSLSDNDRPSDNRWSTATVVAGLVMLAAIVVASPYLLGVWVVERKKRAADNAKVLLKQVPGDL